MEVCNMNEYGKRVAKKMEDYTETRGIDQEINDILNAVKGVEVRGAIASGLKKAYDDASENGNANMEVARARGPEKVLGDRLDKMQGIINDNTSQLAHVDEVISNKASKNEVILKSDGVGLDDAKEDLIAAIQNKEGETTFNLLSIPRDGVVSRKKLTNIVDIYDVDELIDDIFYRVDGTMGNNPLVSSTPAYDVSGGEDVTLTIPPLNQSVSHYLVFFDSNDNAMTSVSKDLGTGSTATETTHNFVVPYGARTYRISLEKASKNNYQLYYRQKTIPADFIDDSIISTITDIVNNFSKDEINLYNPINVLDGIYYRDDGSIGTNVNIGTTKQIFAPSKTKVTIVIPKLNISSLSSFLTFWDKNGTALPDISREEEKGNNIQEVVISFEMPESAYSFTFPIELSSKNRYKIFINNRIESGKWSGEIINFIGDSITEGKELIDGEWVIVDKTYVQHLEDKLGLAEARNYGIASTAISAQSDYSDHTNALINRWMKLNNNVGLNVVFMGTNDFGHNTPLGSMNDRTDISFYGALHVIIPGMIETYSRAKLLFMTPLHRDRTGDNNETNSLGVTLKQYVDAIIEVCNYYGVAVIDTYRISGFNPVIPFIKSTYMPDGLHLNDDGHELFAKNIAGQFESV